MSGCLTTLEPDAEAPAATAARLDAWARYQAMCDAVEFKRKMVDMVDNKAKLALTIMGALNAAVCYVLFRGDPTTLLPARVRPWFAGMLLVYGVVTFAFIVQAIEALRPRTASRARVLAEARRGGARPLGMFTPYDAAPDLGEELRRWREVSADDLCVELVGVNRAIARVLERQVAALERVYRGLRLLLVLAAAMLALAGVVSWLRPIT